MKFLIFGGYSHSNPGDEAILKTTLYYLNDLFPNADFCIWTGIPDYNVQFDRPLNYEMFYWQPLKWIHNRTLWSKVLTKIYTDCYPFSKWIFQEIKRLNGNEIKTLGDFDKVIFIGGGYLNSDYSLIEMNYMTTLAAALKKPIVLLGQTLGPFKKRQHEKMAREIFNKAKSILLRDLQSDQEVVDFRNKVQYGVDDALAFEPQLHPEDKAMIDPYFIAAERQKTFFLGINLRNGPDNRRYYPQIAKAVESIPQSLPGYHLRVIFVPMETSAYCNDLTEGKEFSKYLSLKTDYLLADNPSSPEQKFYLISRLDVLISMRFHSLVFALANGVPAIGFYQDEYYFRKISGLFESFNFEKNMLALNELEGLEPLISKTVLEREPLRYSLLESKERIVKKQKSLLESALVNGERVYS